jgi:hypothetical protein
MIKAKVVVVTGKTDNNAPTSTQPFLFMHLFFPVQLSRTQPFVCTHTQLYQNIAF